MSDAQFPYELLAVPAGAGEAALRRIGRYRTYDEALRVRDETFSTSWRRGVGGPR